MNENINCKRKYLPTLGDLVDRLSIVTLKEWFITERKSEYAQETADIIHDIDLMMKEDETNGKVNGDMIYAIIVLASANLSIWMNEASYRKSGDAEHSQLAKSHSINSIRNFSKNIIQSIVGTGRQDYKLDCITALAENYKPTRWFQKEKESFAKESIDNNIKTS